MTTPLPNPQASAPASAGAQPGAQQQANPLQEMLGKLAMAVRQLGMQNAVIQPEMQQASAIFIAALQKVSQAAGSPPQPMAAPPQQ